MSPQNIVVVAAISLALSACGEPASTWDDSRARFVSTTQQKEEARLEKRWMDKKLDQIDCRLDRLEQKQPGANCGSGD